MMRLLTLNIERTRHLVDLLRSRDLVPASRETELEGNIKKSFPKSSVNIPDAQTSELESAGCDIWNAATNLVRDAKTTDDASAAPPASVRFITLARVFAFMLLDTGYQSSLRQRKDTEKLVRNLKTGLKACRTCLNTGELELASIVIPKCAQYAESAAKESPLVQTTKQEDNDEQHRSTLAHLTSEICLLRLTHAWKVDRLELAEHFYNDFIDHGYRGALTSAVDAAELAYQIGKSLSKKHLPENAATWLERAVTLLDTGDIMELDPDAFELRLTISVALGKFCCDDR